MKDLKCIVFDEDKFTKELIIGFIEKTKGISTLDREKANEADIVFVDAGIFNGDYMRGLKSDAKVVVISSNQQFIHSFFEDEVFDYFNKSMISYDRFLESIEKVRSQLSDT